MLTTKQIRGLQVKFTDGEENRLPLVFQALGDRTRFLIFSILLKRHDLCVTEIARICKMTVAAASHQLKFLEMAGLINRCRNGKTICYKIKDSEPVVAMVKKMVTKK